MKVPPLKHRVPSLPKLIVILVACLVLGCCAKWFADIKRPYPAAPEGVVIEPYGSSSGSAGVWNTLRFISPLKPDVIEQHYVNEMGNLCQDEWAFETLKKRGRFYRHASCIISKSMFLFGNSTFDVEIYTTEQGTEVYYTEGLDEQNKYPVFPTITPN